MGARDNLRTRKRRRRYAAMRARFYTHTAEPQCYCDNRYCLTCNAWRRYKRLGQERRDRQYRAAGYQQDSDGQWWIPQNPMGHSASPWATQEP